MSNKWATNGPPLETVQQCPSHTMDIVIAVVHCFQQQLLHQTSRTADDGLSLFIHSAILVSLEQ
jgi:hypothetical protein